MAFGAFVATALLALVPLDKGEAQLYVDIYPSQEYENGTLFIFSGSSTIARQQSQGRGFRTTGSDWLQDTAYSYDPLFASQPGTGIKPLTAVPASTATVTNKDYESLIGYLRVRNAAFSKRQPQRPHQRPHPRRREHQHPNHYRSILGGY